MDFNLYPFLLPLLGLTPISTAVVNRCDCYFALNGSYFGMGLSIGHHDIDTLRRS